MTAAGAVPFGEALRIWLKLGFISFGGPAGQIALMHRILVEEKRWLSDARFLHALNYCMLLPGPEAQQLATYAGWLLHGVRGGLVAGVLFVLPGALLITGIALAYALYGELPWMQGLLLGFQAATLPIVVEAVIRIGKRALRHPLLWALAAASFLAIFLFGAPFPAIVVVAGLLGLAGVRLAPQAFARGANDGFVPEPAPPVPWRWPLQVIAIGGLLWFAPIALLTVTVGGVLLAEALFFSQTAVVSFGGAYAVLAYVAQQAVERYGWLSAPEMVQGLALAETTPGPLILVLTYVGFLAAWRAPGALEPVTAGLIGAAVSTWVTFVPSMLWIFLGAPYIERQRGNRVLSAALTGITAAIVGVILNLSVWFAMHVLFARVETRTIAGMSLDVPDPASLNWASLALAAVAALALFRFHLGVVRTLLLCGALGLALASTSALAAEPEALPSIVVQGERAQAPPSLSWLGRDDLASLPTHPSELLFRVPGTWVTRGSGQEHLTALRSPVLAGAGACGEALFLEDGVPIRPAGFCNVNQLFEIDTEQAEGIEVLRGPHTVLYGSNALHGAINVLSPPSGTPAAYALSYGAEDFRQLRVLQPAGNLLLRALATGAGSFRDGEGYDQYKASLRWTAGESVTQLSAARLQQETAGFIVGRDAYRDDVLREQNLNPEAFRDADALRLYHRLPLWETEATFFARSSRMEFVQHFLPGKPIEENGQDSAGAIVRREWDWGVLGADFEAARGTLLENQPLPITAGSEFNQAVRPAGRHYDYGVDSQMGAVYGQRQWRLAAGTLAAGARLEYLRYDYATGLAAGNLREDGSACDLGGCLFNRPADRSDEFFNFAPKLEYARPFAIGTASLTLARGFRAPQATELYRLQRGQDVADLQSTTLDSAELGWSAGSTALHYDLAAYWMRKRHVILRDAEGFNVSDGATRHQGLEASVRAERAGWSLALDGTYALHRYDFSRAAEQGEVIVDGRVVDTAPRTLGSLRLGRRWAALRGELEWLHVGEHFADAAGRAAYPGHDLLNLFLMQDLPGRWALTLAARNLFDARYAERADFAFDQYRYFPGAGRSWLVQLSWSHS